MGRKNSAQTYNFALLGIVALVALVAVVLIVSTFSPGSWVQENVRGQATEQGESNPEAIQHQGANHDVLSVSEGGAFLSGDASVLDIFQNKVRINAPVDGLPSMYDVNVGDTVPMGAYTVTLYGIEQGDAQLVVASAADACGSSAGKTPLCRGQSTCCGNVCTLIPTCVGKANGHLTTCGNRQMYCCNEELSLVSCGGSS